VLFAPPNFHITPVTWRDLVYRASATGSLYRSPLAIMAQTIRAILLASAIAATLVGRLASKAASQGRWLVPWIFGVTDDRKRAGHKQAAQIAVTLLAYIAEPVLASTGVLLRQHRNSAFTGSMYNRNRQAACWILDFRRSRALGPSPATSANQPDGPAAVS
jgi:hypothetical protein